QFTQVRGLAFDTTGNLYCTDGNRIRKITVDGKIQTIAGTGVAGFSGDNGQASKAQVRSPYGIAVDQANNVYFADTGNHRIRKIATDGTITTSAGNGLSAQPINGASTGTSLPQPYGLATDSSNNVYVTDLSYGLVLKITPNQQISRIAGSF